MLFGFSQPIMATSKRFMAEIILKSGEYNIEDRFLKFDLTDDLEFSNRRSCYTLRGGNGYGKTSFIEKILIPRLENNKIDYLYLGQDIRTQLYTIRALMSVKGFKVYNADENKLLKLWIEQSQSATIFILDEFDKYFPDFGFIFDWCDAFIRTYIIVTHIEDNRMEPDQDKYTIYRMKFEPVDINPRMKSIRIMKEKSW